MFKLSAQEEFYLYEPNNGKEAIRANNIEVSMDYEVTFNNQNEPIDTSLVQIYQYDKMGRIILDVYVDGPDTTIYQYEDLTSDYLSYFKEIFPFENEIDSVAYSRRGDTIYICNYSLLNGDYILDSCAYQIFEDHKIIKECNSEGICYRIYEYDGDRINIIGPDQTVITQKIGTYSWTKRNNKKYHYWRLDDGQISQYVEEGKDGRCIRSAVWIYDKSRLLDSKLSYNQETGKKVITLVQHIKF